MLAQRDIVDAVDRAARQLVSVEHGARRSIIQTPLVFPSGSLVGIRVTLDSDGFSVSDGGGAFEEARMLRAVRSFNAHAPVVAAEAGIHLEGGVFSLQRVPANLLSGAIVSLANVAHGASVLSANRQAVLDARQAEERLFARLSRLFGHVEMHKSILGASGTTWDVDAVVRADDRVVLFESVLPRKQSIYAAVTKFHDIARAPEPPVRVAAIPSRIELGSMLGVLSQAASVVEDATPDDALIRLALAA